MSDDPWRTPDPHEPPPQQPQQWPPAPQPYAPPAYGPPPYGTPPYGQAPYGQPPYYGYDPNNPYQAPLPKRGGVGRLVWILCTAGLLLLGGCGVGIYFLANSLTKNADEANAFLRNVRDQQFMSAYQQLCPSTQAALPPGNFTTALMAAVLRNQGVSSFDITSSNTSKVSGAGTVRTASGEVTFRDGSSRAVNFTLGKNSGHLCISSGFEALE